MFKYEFIEKKEIVKTKTATLTYCDYCNKLITKHKVGAPKNYSEIFHCFEITTGHNDWGNDSADSIEHKHCCVDCIGKVFSDYIDIAKEGRNTEYIEIDHIWFYQDRESEVENE